MGLERAEGANLPMASAVLLGVVTATGGGVLRDLLSGERPSIVPKGDLYTTAAFAGAMVYLLLVHLIGVPIAAGRAAAIAGAATLRLLALHFHWSAPGPIGAEEPSPR
jgi:uncharacterized membrane protein YeiH